MVSYSDFYDGRAIFVRIGGPDGFGSYGQLTVTTDGRLLCHECGGTYLHLATHLTRSHGVTAERYRVTHGLLLTMPLVAASVSHRMARSWEANREQNLEALARHRDPLRARESARPVSQWTAATRAARVKRLAEQRGRALTEAEKQELGGDLPITEWCRRVRGLLAGDPTLSVASISRSFDMSASWAYRRLHRYPQQGDEQCR
ncbi:MucR family transcriptional regulator [Mycobacterium gordonae]|uniref:MucR family transcriptional regulator n=1 Tax=Mycobacterium gordonae TaxID=1778 RepID=A0A1X1VYP9_MYCGO|nr:MucR family transcriptional regulator [Mycobacterium gordonae]MCV7006759.1 MucR family transcriptional regulator [Mycobacterium gordonae]ODR16411.1 hypothetical protein BHQ23_30065 [Mycobacterium gordonae]ORV75014.1 hypothetical protein AWC08_00735 [Mycobacterium gordonae]